jgi:hypothetical protein
MGIAPDPHYVIRMLFELERADNPPLFDELMKFAKGTKRLNRLRTLAHEGLVAQRCWAPATARAGATREKMSDEQRTSDQVLAAASSELFGPAIDA